MLNRTSFRMRATVGAIGATVAAAFVVVSLATPARAATDPRLAAVFEWFDADHDGKVSAAEFNDSIAAPEPMGAIGLIVDTKTRPSNETRDALFARLDANHDGMLSLRELAAQAVIRTVVTPEIAAADANRDGKISEAELAAYIAAHRAAEGLTNPSAGAALMAHGIIAEHDRGGHGLATIADLER